MGEWPGYPLNFLRRTPAQKDTVAIPIANSVMLKYQQIKKHPNEMPIHKIHDHPRRSRTVWSVAEKIINYQLSIINYQLSIINYQLINHSTYSTTYL